MARGAGADVVGVTSARPFAREREATLRRRRDGKNGRLHFTYDDPETATDIRTTWPWARSIVVVGRSYVASAPPPAETGAVVARFATSDHYEQVRIVLRALTDVIGSHGGRAAWLSDDNRLMDRAVAVRAGAGWSGRSTMVLSPGIGPWMLLGSVVTDLLLEPTAPMTRTCGTCRECVPACPTLAITEDGIDARRCLSAWLQSPGSLPHWVRLHIDRRIYGCDDCLTSCPPGGAALDSVTVEPRAHDFSELLSLSDTDLIEHFAWWYVPKREPRFLRRNIVVAAGNSREPAVRHSIEAQFEHVSSLVRGHAYWALARLEGQRSWTRLREQHATETAPDALRELEWAMAMTRASNPGR